MKKVLTIICALSIFVVLSACGSNSVENPDLAHTDKSSDVQEYSSEVSIIETTAPMIETTVQLSEDELIKRIATCFSTPDVEFTCRTSSDQFYILGGDNYDIDINVSTSDYGNKNGISRVDVIFNTESAEDVCYNVLDKIVQYDGFELSLDEQIEILAYYQASQVSFENDDLKISETQSGSVRIISFRFK